MSDGFTELEEFVMDVLVAKRPTAAHTIADAQKIIEHVIAATCKQLAVVEKRAMDAEKRVVELDGHLECYDGCWVEGAKRRGAIARE